MALYDAFKDVIDIAQKADNIDLYRKLLDLSRDALDLQNEIYRLTEENQELKRKLEEEQTVIRHKEGGYITIKGDEQEIQYCSTCWGNNHKLIQLVNKRCYNCDMRWMEAHK